MIPHIKEFIKQLDEIDSYESMKRNEAIVELVNLLVYASDRYHNYGDSPLSDEEFDNLERKLYNLDKTNEYFIGVGSTSRGEKLKLPYPMGGLNQIPVGGIEKWVTSNNLSNEQLIITDKMDGVSCLLIYNEIGEIQIAYSRGDGFYAQDITRHVLKINNIPKKIPKKMVIRGEIEMSDLSFEKSVKIISSRSGTQYKNARNAVIGLMNADINNELVYDYLSFIPYQIIDSNLDKEEQLKLLEDLNFQPVSYKKYNGNEITDELLIEIIKDRKKELNFAIDGIVIDINNNTIRSKISTKEEITPKYSIKYKVMDETNVAIATVIGVEWNVSKHGFMKPRVNVEPIELSGVTVQYATGFNAKFINDNNIGPGAQIQITRSGDVIPYILGIVKPAKTPQLPTCDCYWNETNVDLIIKDHHEEVDVMIEQTLAFFTNLKIPQLKEGNVRVLFEINEYNNAMDAINEILNYDKIQLESFIGENGRKIYDGLRNKFSEIELYELMGSLPLFGIGLGTRKFKKLINSLKIINIDQIKNLTIQQLITVESFEEKTSLKVLSGLEKFIEFYNTLPKYVNIVFYKETTKDIMNGQVIVFTGFRDTDLQKTIESYGGKVTTSVSKNTTLVVCNDPLSGSSKIQKAIDLGIKVIDVVECKNMLGINTEEKIHKVKKKEDDLLEF